MRMLTIQTSPVRLDRPEDRFRIPIRHVLSRNQDFEEKFDFRTLFYDVFWSADGADILCVGPPFRFGYGAAQALQFIALPAGVRCDFRHERRGKDDGLHPSVFRIRPPPNTSGLEIVFGKQRCVVAIQPNLSSIFAGQDVLLVVSKDNPLEWIIDWINYHTRNFSFRGLLFMDNGSSAYELDEISDAIRRHCELETCAIMATNFPYGPVKALDIGGKSDSNFLQVGMYETVRSRMLNLARMVANFDIDELLVQRGCDAPLWNLVQASNRPFLLIPRFNATGGVPAGVQPRHNMFDRLVSRRAQLPKWVVRPDLCGPDMLWHVHYVIPSKGLQADADGPLFIAHLLPLTTGWKNQSRLVPNRQSLESAEPDHDLREHLDRAFAADAPISLWSPMKNADCGYLCHAAAKALRDGKPDESLNLARRALAISPDYASARSHEARALRVLGRDAEAVAAENCLLQRREGDPDFHAMMARLELHRRRWAEASRWCAKGLERAPLHAELNEVKAILETRGALPAAAAGVRVPDS